jgi:sec-independent protein translocase protein TatA
MFGGFGIWELLVIALIVVLLFGTKNLPKFKLSKFGSELGGAIKNFRGAIKDSKEVHTDISEATTKNVIEGDVDIDKDDPKGSS